MDSMNDIMANFEITDIVRRSLSTSVMIAAIVIIRIFMLHRLPKKTFLFLWGIVVCRLLIPFSIPSYFSIYTGINTAQRFLEGKKIPSPSGMPVDISMRHMLDTGGTYFEIGRMNVAFVSPAEFLWIGGILVTVLFFTLVYIKYHREFRMSLPVANDFTTRWLQEHHLRRTVQVRQIDRINAPLTYGIFRPVILLPKETDWMDERKLAYTLTHELVHIKRFDTLTKLLLTAAVCVHWFNPIVWMMYLLANDDIELSCDETVVQIFGYSVKSGYAMMLISIAEKRNKAVFIFNHFNKNAIEERIRSIMKIKKISMFWKALAAFLVVSISIVFATSAIALGGKTISNPDEKAIYEYLNTKTDDLMGKAGEGKFYSAFTILSTDRDKIYLQVMKAKFVKQGNEVVQADTVISPLVLYVKNTDKGMIIAGHEGPVDGVGYGRSLKRIFPDNVRKIMEEVSTEAYNKQVDQFTIEIQSRAQADFNN